MTGQLTKTVKCLSNSLMKTCDTCKKKMSINKCKVLTDMIGKKQECWAWSAGPEWENKARQETKDYSLSKGVKNFVANNM